MIYLSGAAHNLIRNYGMEGLGLMVTPRYGRPEFGIPWAIDNDCFNRGEAFDWDAFVEWLPKPYAQTALFVPAPDVVGDAEATLQRSLPCLSIIRALGFPVALVGQDGLFPEDVPWNDIDCLFIGGTTEWKLSQAARQCVDAAKALGKWTHMGRVNSEKRFKIAYEWGVDSVDGTFLKFGPDHNWPLLKKWLRNNLQGRLGDVHNGQYWERTGSADGC